MNAAAELKLIVNDMMNEQFTLEDVSELMYQTLLKKEHAKDKLQISRIGIISGFVDFNGELEVIVKFMDDIEQYTKQGLHEKAVLIIEDLDDE